MIAYEHQLERNVFDLQEALLHGSWQHQPYQPFTVHDPKPRRIHKAMVRDRVVHQAVVNVLDPLIDPRLIYDSYSCRVGKGTHAAVRRLRIFLQQASNNHKRTVHVLKCDVKKFFDSVDHDILVLLLNRHVCDPNMLDLVYGIIESFQHSSGKGLPLGNSTSQLFANVYLHELDYFVKFRLRERWYLRYCDDFLIVHPSRDHLMRLAPRVQLFLRDNLSLELHPAKVTMRTWTQGIDFLGYVLLPHAMVLRTKTRRRIIVRVNERNISSYLGLCKHANAYEVSELLRHLVFSHE